MRRADDVRQTEQRAFLGRLDLEDVKGRTGDMAGLYGFSKGCLIDQPAARAVDDANTWLRLCKRLLVEDAARLVGHRHMQGDEVSLGKKLLQFDLGDAHFLGPLLGQEGIVGDDVHLQPEGARNDDRADVSGTDDAECLARDFDTHEFRLFPLAGLRRGIGLRQLTGNGKHQRNSVFGRRDRIAERRVHDDDAAAGRCRDIDIVNADAGAANDLKICGGSDQLFRRLGRGADRETVIIADDFGKFVLVLAELRLEIDLDATVAENLDGSFRQFVGYENARCHDGLLRMGSAMKSMKCCGSALSAEPESLGQAAALESVAFCVWKAQASQGISAFISDVSIVAPAQMRRPDGASR